jgi:hypothetical protein
MSRKKNYILSNSSQESHKNPTETSTDFHKNPTRIPQNFHGFPQNFHKKLPRISTRIPQKLPRIFTRNFRRNFHGFSQKLLQDSPQKLFTDSHLFFYLFYSFSKSLIKIHNLCFILISV